MTIVGRNKLFGISESRPTLNYKRRFKSPIFNFANTLTLATDDKELIDFEEDTPATRKYNGSVFPNLRISNASSSNILIELNQDPNQVIFVASGTSEVVDKELIGGVKSLKIQNLGATSITANQIRLMVWNDGSTIDDIVSRSHELAFTEDKSLTNIKDFLRLTKKGAI